MDYFSKDIAYGLRSNFSIGTFIIVSLKTSIVEQRPHLQNVTMNDNSPPESIGYRLHQSVDGCRLHLLTDVYRSLGTYFKINVVQSCGSQFTKQIAPNQYKLYRRASVTYSWYRILMFWDILHAEKMLLWNCGAGES